MIWKKRPKDGDWLWFEDGVEAFFASPDARLGPHKLLRDTPNSPPCFSVEVYDEQGRVVCTRWVNENTMRPESLSERSARITAETEPWRAKRDENLRHVFKPRRDED